MLVLSRRPGESIVITLPSGEVIRVTVVQIDRDKMRLSIDAPVDVRIMREELLPRPEPELGGEG